MKKYLVGALCASYFLLVPVQATVLICSPQQTDAEYFACIGKCAADNWWTPAWMCALL
ncbi:hypothetical protein [Xenorhabdus anantnagensis]|uniref:Uncharacterized protein n=1 Tax=Xenorhabdus anantnagensis TaxID=3025875 RepID=A0ABT5LVP2_9GAMM|nr:hypothetical protein [Xenorhabdus anantnagensis]MDC9598498.1 hypothetical protein [Xenorhabdus anantnagensis]